MVFGEEPQTRQSGPPSAVMKVDNFGLLQKESSGSAMASKTGVVTRATGGATGSGATAGGSALTGTAGKVTAKAKAEVERLRMLIVEVGFRLFVRDVTRPAACPHIHHARHMAEHVSSSLLSFVQSSSRVCHGISECYTTLGWHFLHTPTS